MKKFLMKNRTWGTMFCPGSSDGCEEGTDMIWRNAQTPSQPLQQMKIPETQELEPGIRTVRTSDPHTTSGNSGKGSGQRGVPGS